MIRVQPHGERFDSAEEKKKTREAVVANIATFALLITLIRAVPYALKQFHYVIVPYMLWVRSYLMFCGSKSVASFEDSLLSGEDGRLVCCRILCL
ncbi:hypothetical protein C0J52_22303 [Blattella germanica]|nr:hypothetical protein C0J52_22303 [Blattella germanica]